MPCVPQPVAVATTATAISRRAPRTRRDHMRLPRAQIRRGRRAVAFRHGRRRGHPGASFASALSAYATGVTVVTAIGPQGPSGATANAVTLPLARPADDARLPRPGISRTLTSVRAQGRFGVNALAAGQEELARRFSGKDPEAGEVGRRSSGPRASGLPRLGGRPALGRLRAPRPDRRRRPPDPDRQRARGRVLETASRSSSTAATIGTCWRSPRSAGPAFGPSARSPALEPVPRADGGDDAIRTHSPNGRPS